MRRRKQAKPVEPVGDNWETVAAVGFRVGRKWVTGHLGGAYGPEISRVRRDLILDEDLEIEEVFMRFNQMLLIKTMKMEKRAMAKVAKRKGRG